MSPVQQELQIWSGGALNIIKLIGKALLLFAENLKKIKCLKIWRILKIWKKKGQNSALSSTHWPPKNWPGAIDHIAIGLVDNKYTKLGKIDEKVLLIFGLSYIKIPLC